MKKSFGTIFHLLTLFAFVAAFSFTACNDDDDDGGASNKYGIPSDSQASQNPEVGTPTTTIPNISYTVERDGDDAIVRIDMTGVQAAKSLDWMRLVGTAQEGQNVWVSVDGKPKGIVVYNNADNQGEQKLLADLVFLVDNSGSMSEEADAVARDIQAWAQQLEASNLDIKFGCVGYSVWGTINGAFNLNTADSLSYFLSRYTGTSRTMGFEGADALALENAATTINRNSTDDECGGMALRYADQNIKFRVGSNRIYVNFTDEPNQPDGKAEYSVEFFKDQANWATNQGTVHTVFSEDTTYYSNYWRAGYYERPWLISDYTGGTKLFATDTFTGVTLSSLPVTGAMTNSYVIRFTNISEFMDGQDHVVKITIRSTDGLTCAERTFVINFGTN